VIGNPLKVGILLTRATYICPFCQSGVGLGYECSKSSQVNKFPIAKSQALHKPAEIEFPDIIYEHALCAATRALSPTGMFGGKVPLHLAAQKSRPHAPPAPTYARYAILLSLHMGSIN
jgi:hypothetical protein